MDVKYTYGNYTCSTISEDNFEYACLSLVYYYNNYIIYYYSGPDQPMMPVLVGTGIISDSSALIQWTVSSIAYTPETYVVKYRTSQDNLDMTSDPTDSGEDITVVNQMYSVQLSNLEPATQYYYQVVATNTALSRSSNLLSFRTSDNGKY